MKFVQQNPIVIKDVSQTCLTLLPKCEDPSTISQFRPISLCHAIDKIITKAIANRIKKIFPTMVSLLQASFIQGQNSVDNSIILLELTNSINHPYTKKGFIGMKLDLQKAYTRLE